MVIRILADCTGGNVESAYNAKLVIQIFSKGHAYSSKNEGEEGKKRKQKEEYFKFQNP